MTKRLRTIRTTIKHLFKRILIASKRPSIATALTVGFSALIIIAVISNLIVGLLSARRNTVDLIQDKTVLIVKSVTERTRLHLDPARAQTEYLASLVAAHVVDPNSQEMLIAYLTAALAATPQIMAITYLSDDLQAIRVNRSNTDPIPIISDFNNISAAELSMTTLRQSEDSYWSLPIYAPGINSTILNIFTPVRRDGEFLGAFAASVLINELSDFLSDFKSDDNDVSFILLGPDEVLAHPSLVNGFAGLSVQTPLPLLNAIDDPVLRAIWDPNKTEAITEFTYPGFTALLVTVDSTTHVVVYQYMQKFGGIPWIIGSHFLAQDIAGEFTRLEYAAYIGLTVLVLAVLAAFFLARYVSRPIKQLAAVAMQIRKAGPYKLPPLPTSHLYELDTASKAFNEMAEGLCERELLRDTFGKYVPSSIADAIISDRGILQPHTRTATILFTDIVGFSTISETMAPERLIALLNDYFSILIEIIERNGGVIHQFQGDAILATYNLPMEDPDHAEKAVRTALDIQQALSHRTFGDGIVLQTRIGINTGVVVGGTVGAGSRLGFTVHGDAVNVAARIEQMNKQYGTFVLVAQSTVELVGAAFAFELMGELPVRGRQQSVVLYQLANTNQHSQIIPQTLSA